MFKYIQIFLIGIPLISLFSCIDNQHSKESKQMDSIAEGYVKLVLNIGLYDSSPLQADRTLKVKGHAITYFHILNVENKK